MNKSDIKLLLLSFALVILIQIVFLFFSVEFPVDLVESSVVDVGEGVVLEAIIFGPDGAVVGEELGDEVMESFRYSFYFYARYDVYVLVKNI